MGDNQLNIAHRQYTNAEYINMYKCYIREGEDFQEAVLAYALLYPNLRHPDHRVIRNIVRSMDESGCINPHARERQVAENTPAELTHLILRAFEEDSNLSLRICALRLEAPHTLIHRILIKNHWYPYHYRKVQVLHGENDRAARMLFCRTFIANIVRNPVIHIYILWSDECTFTRNGIFNSKNFVHWSDRGNPHETRETNAQYRWSINIWAGIIANQLVSQLKS